MSRGLGLILLILVVVLAVTGSVLAQCQPQQRDCNRKGDCHCPQDQISGKIVEIDSAAKTLVVDTSDGRYTVTTDADTVIKRCCKVIKFEDLKIGDSIMARGELTGRVLAADMICVRCR